MAFTTAGGYGNLPNGNFSPVSYSKQVQLAFRKSTVCGDITNSDYFGEIAAQGDTVKIIKEPEISVSSYARGTQVSAQDLDDEDFSLVVDKANYFAFKMDDIEEAHSHVNFMDLATNRAAYRLADQHDQEVLGYLSGYKQSSLHTQADTVNDTVNGTKAVDTAGSDELLSSMKLKKGDFGNITTASAGDHSIPVAARLPGATALPTATISPAMMGFPFNVSCDNLHGDFEPDRLAFMHKVHKEVVGILEVGLPPRVKMLSEALRDFYDVEPLCASQFIVK